MLKLFATETYSRLADPPVHVVVRSGALPGPIALPGGKTDALTTCLYNARPATIYGGRTKCSATSWLPAC